MMVRTALGIALIPLLVLGCGGKLEQRKQQVTIGITPNQETTLQPGDRIGLSAGAKAIDEPLTAMRWTIEAVTTPEQLPRPVIANMNCTDVTLTIKDDDGVGNCKAELSIPTTALPMTWRIAATATSTSKGTASASFVLKVVAPDLDDGNFRIEVPPLVSTNANGGPLLTNQLVTIEANALSDHIITNLSYSWVLKSSPSSSAPVLAGVKSSKLQFVPRVAGDYQLTVTATGTVNGREVTESSDVLVIVEDSDAANALTVSAGDAKSVVGGDGSPTTLTGTASRNGTALANPTYKWAQIGGPAVTLANPGTATPTFLAPAVTEDTDLIFQLDVSATINGVVYTGTSQTVVRVLPPDGE